MAKTPSERIKEIHRSLKVLAGKDPTEPGFNSASFFETAIIKFLDEQFPALEEDRDKKVNHIK